jgi:hypothetical protein
MGERMSSLRLVRQCGTVAILYRNYLLDCRDFCGILKRIVKELVI